MSDAHFGTKFFWFDELAPEDSEAWSEKLVRDLETVLDSSGLRDPQRDSKYRKQFDLLAFSGDLTCSGQTVGMAGAELFFAKLQTGRWRADKILLIPGNHDMVFGKKPTAVDLPKTLFINQPKEQREALYRETYRKITGEEPSPSLGVAFSFPAHRLSILGLNSCRLESWSMPGIGFVGCDQIMQLGDAIFWTEFKESLSATPAEKKPWHRLTFLHHHLTGMSDVSAAALVQHLEHPHFTLTWDADYVTRALRMYGVDFVLHGHFHRPDARADVNSDEVYCRVLSAGSAGIAGDLCSQRHQFFVLEIQDKEDEDPARSLTRELVVTSFERPLDLNGGKWQKLEPKFFPFTSAPVNTASPSTVSMQIARARAARSMCHAYESYPAAVLFLTELDTPKWIPQLKEVHREFALIWDRRRQLQKGLPSVAAAFALLMRRIQVHGPELLREFTHELSGESLRSLTAFLVEKIVFDKDLPKAK